MAKSLPPLNLLIAFEAVARQLSFSKAAAELFLTQPAVSRQIKKLETHLNVTLFDRTHNSIILTDQGSELYEAAREVISKISGIVDVLNNDTKKHEIFVSTTTSFSSLWLIPRLYRFNAKHPNILIHLSADNRLVDLDKDHIDVAIRYCADEKTPDHFVTTLAVEQIFPVCSPLFLKRLALNHTEETLFDEHHLLHLEDNLDKWPWLQWKHWFRAVGDNRKPSQGFVFSHYDQLIQAACTGQGVALGSSPLTDSLLLSGRLVRPVKKNITSPRSFHVLRNNRNNPDVDTFISWLCEEMTTTV